MVTDHWSARRLAHQYEVVEPTILARIARDHIPTLIDAIRTHLDEGLD